LTNCGQFAVTVVGVLVGAGFSLLTSWWVADSYFKKQRAIDKAKEEEDVHLAYGRLMYSFFAAAGKRPKSTSIRQAMSEFEAKLKIYNRDFDAAAIQKSGIEHALQMIKDQPDDFEDIPK
jgi:hypothetical protein